MHLKHPDLSLKQLNHQTACCLRKPHEMKVMMWHKTSCQACIYLMVVDFTILFVEMKACNSIK
ncbi:CLUMA_CG005379, isoform A [Clunio marinus]|uniref:CLUMA_CG005379, isoform A n=1 Tax=Clunio marinus TaxID=568069 RepID=A0A1J1I035_9DIPT|nr:CLUMA_CG005379, isoform A [Clunio marinus]